MLKFILADTDGAGFKKIAELMRRRMDAGSGDMVLLVPEQLSHGAERELAGECGGRACMYAEVLSFTRLYTRVAAQTGGLADPVPDKGGKLLLLSLAMEAASPRLRHYGDRGRRAEFLMMLLDALEELNGSSIDAEALMKASGEASGTVAGKLHDLAVTAEAYGAVLERSLGDSRDRIRRLADSIYDSSVGSGGFYISGFSDFTSAELSVLDAVLRRGTDVTVALAFRPGGGEHFRLTERTYFALKEAAEKRFVQVETTALPKAEESALSRLRDGLYDHGAGTYEGDCGAVELYRAESPLDECRLAAGRILELMRLDETLSFSDFSVAAADSEKLSSYIQSVFSDYGIPFYSGEKSELREKSIIAFALEALDTVRGGWSYGSVFRYLKTGLAGLSPDECDLLENYCLMWGVRGSMWTRPESWDMNPRGFAKEKTEEDERLLERIDGYRRRVAGPLESLAEDMEKADTAGKAAAALYAFFERTELAGALEEKAARLARAGMSGEAAEYARLWDVLIDCLDRLYTVLGETPMNADEFRNILELLLSVCDIGLIPPTLDSVSIGGTSRARMHRARCLIVLGADDTAIPGSSDAGGLFSEDEKKTLFDMGIRLISDRDEAVDRRLYELWQLTAAASERIIISYSGGKNSRPSLLITRAEALLGKKTVSTDAADRAYMAAAPGPCFSFALSGSAEAEACTDAERLGAVRAAVSRERGRLSRRSVDRLYGRSIRLTASRADDFSQCRFMYFMKYGLKADQRKKAAFDPPELGTFVHFVLENTARTAKEKGGFAALSGGELRSLVGEYTEKYVERYFTGGELNDPRFAYLFARLRETVDAIAEDVAGELAVSDFEPLDFELRFADGADMPAARAGDIKITGVVDRVDGWQDGDRLYLRVADYKTGKKSFSLSDVRYGRGIQMLIYLFVLAEHGRKRYGREVVPAGVLYCPARDVTVALPRNATDEEIAEERRKKLKRSGLILADERVVGAMENDGDTVYLPVEFKKGELRGSIAGEGQLAELSRYVDGLLAEMGRCMNEGRIEANPLFKGKESPCDYCPYTEACAFDESRDGPRLQRNLKDAEFWREISAGGGGENG